jgi:ketosteroid isomerase-like protein
MFNGDQRNNIKGGSTMIGAMAAKDNVKLSMEFLNRRDVSMFMMGWADDAVWIYPGDSWMSGRFEGKKAIREWFDNLMEQFPKVKYTVNSVSVTNIFDFVGNNVASAHCDVEFTNKDGYHMKSSGVVMLTIKGGKVIEGKNYLFAVDEYVKTGWGTSKPIE